MKSKKPLPPNRTLEQVWNHYLVEKEIAQRLKASDREERKRIYDSMYDELFAKVPDHPRLTRRRDDGMTRLANVEKLSIISRFLRGQDVFAEFAPGDCRFALEIARRVHFVYGIDISDQRNPEDEAPDNFDLVVYDGYNLEAIKDSSVDIVFSDQLIEHFHPEDTKLHFELVLRILKPGGKYVFRTPHALTGPHDISAYFSDEPEGLHLKEWTYGELLKIVMSVGYSRFRMYVHRKGINVRMPRVYFLSCEKILGSLPKATARPIARRLIPSIVGIVIK